MGFNTQLVRKFYKQDLYLLHMKVVHENCKLFKIHNKIYFSSSNIKSINCLVHFSFYLNCSTINRSSSNHCVGRPFPKPPVDILLKKIFIKSYNKCIQRKMTMQKDYFRVNCMDQINAEPVSKQFCMDD